MRGSRKHENRRRCYGYRLWSKELVLGAVNAVKEYGCETVLVGDEKIIRELLVKYGADKNPKITIHHASEVIAMDEHPAIAVKSKKDASIVVAAGLLRNNECDALVSSGSTGAAVCLSAFCVGASGCGKTCYCNADSQPEGYDCSA